MVPFHLMFVGASTNFLYVELYRCNALPDIITKLPFNPSTSIFFEVIIPYPLFSATKKPAVLGAGWDKD
jgi:hypothetical protein